MTSTELTDLINEVVNPLGGDPKVQGAALNGLLKSLAGELAAGQLATAAVATALGSLPPPEVTRADVAAGLATKADLLNGKLALSQLPDALLGQVRYKGTYLFGTNVVASDDAALHGQPLPASAPATLGWYLLVRDAGTLGNQDFNSGDWLISNGAAGWDKIDNTDAVTTVAGRTGAISLAKADVGLDQADNTSDAAKPLSAAALAALAAKADLVGGRVPAAQLPPATATAAGAVRPAPDSFALAPDGTLRPLRYTDLTYAQLTAQLSASQLVPYAWYRLTDYQTVHLINGTSVLNTALVEPLLLQAAAPNALNPAGYSATYPTDVVYYVTNNYDARLNGATKGGIVRRLDAKYNNDFDIDFRNVKVRRWLNTTTGLYTEGPNANAFQDYPFFNATTYNSGRINNNLCRLSAGQPAYGLFDIVVDANSSFFNNELRYSAVTRLTVLSNSSVYSNLIASSDVSDNYLANSAFTTSVFSAAYISGNALTASSTINSNNVAGGNITRNVLNGSFIIGNYLFQNATIGGNALTKAAINNNVLYANSDIRDNILLRTATAGSISIESNILNFSSVISGNTLKVTNSGFSKNYLNNSFIYSQTLGATIIQGHKLYNTTNPTFGAQSQFFVDGSVLLKTVNGLAPNAAGNLTTADQAPPPASLTSAVAGGTFSSGELTGTPPSGSLPGMRFCDATYRYEYQYGMANALVWVRTLKS